MDMEIEEVIKARFGKYLAAKVALFAVLACKDTGVSVEQCSEILRKILAKVILNDDADGEAEIYLNCADNILRGYAKGAEHASS